MAEPHFTDLANDWDVAFRAIGVSLRKRLLPVVIDLENLQLGIQASRHYSRDLVALLAMRVHIWTTGKVSLTVVGFNRRCENGTQTLAADYLTEGISKKREVQ